MVDANKCKKNAICWGRGEFLKIAKGFNIGKCHMGGLGIYKGVDV